MIFVEYTIQKIIECFIQICYNLRQKKELESKNSRILYKAQKNTAELK